MLDLVEAALSGSPSLCPAASPVSPASDGPSVVCGVIERENGLEAASAEVPALVSGRRSSASVLMFCAGQGIPGPKLLPLDEIVEAVDPEVAHRSYCYVDCPVWRDELDRVAEARAGARLEAAGVERIVHPDRPDGLPPVVRA